MRFMFLLQLGTCIFCQPFERINTIYITVAQRAAFYKRFIVLNVYFPGGMCFATYPLVRWIEQKHSKSFQNINKVTQPETDLKISPTTGVIFHSHIPASNSLIRSLAGK